MLMEFNNTKQNAKEAGKCFKVGFKSLGEGLLKTLKTPKCLFDDYRELKDVVALGREVRAQRENAPASPVSEQ